MSKREQFGTENGCDIMRTPKELFSKLDYIYKFSVDAACSSVNKLCGKGFCLDLGINGLEVSWRGEYVFCNPPFSKKIDWIKKASNEVMENGCPLCVMILPTNSMSSSIWHDAIYGRFNYEILNGRVQFLDPDEGKATSGNNSGTTLVYFIKKIGKPSKIVNKGLEVL